jgi:hypothetical protein
MSRSRFRASWWQILLRFVGPALFVACSVILGAAGVPDGYNFTVSAALALAVDFLISRLIGPSASALWWWTVTTHFSDDDD